LTTDLTSSLYTSDSETPFSFAIYFIIFTEPFPSLYVKSKNLKALPVGIPSLSKIVLPFQYLTLWIEVAKSLPSSVFKSILNTREP